MNPKPTQEYSLEQAQQYVFKVLSDHGIAYTDVEELAIEVAVETAWEGAKYPMKARKYDININTLRSYGSKLWRNLSDILEKDIHPLTFRACIKETMAEKDGEDGALFQIQESNGSKASDKEATSNVANSNYKTISKETLKSPSIPVKGVKLPKAPFYGRRAEVADLKSLVEKYSLVIVLGVKGIGKRSLAANYIQTSEQFPFSEVIWKPLHHKPSGQELEAELNNLLSLGNPGQSFLEQLRFLQENEDKTYLIVLEDLDSLVNAEEEGRNLKSEYVSIIRRVVEETDSKVIITTTIPIRQVNSLILDEVAQKYTLHGLSYDEAILILGSEFKGDSQKIIEAVGGNPSLLKSVASWFRSTSPLDPKIANRGTLVRSIIDSYGQGFDYNLYFDEEERLLLKEIVKSNPKKGLSYSKLFEIHPEAGPMIMEFIDMGIILEYVDSGQRWLRLSPTGDNYLHKGKIRL